MVSDQKFPSGRMRNKTNPLGGCYSRFATGSDFFSTGGAGFSTTGVPLELSSAGPLLGAGGGAGAATGSTGGAGTGAGAAGAAAGTNEGAPPGTNFPAVGLKEKLDAPGFNNGFEEGAGLKTTCSSSCCSQESAIFYQLYI